MKSRLRIPHQTTAGYANQLPRNLGGRHQFAEHIYMPPASKTFVSKPSHRSERSTSQPHCIPGSCATPLTLPIACPLHMGAVAAARLAAAAQPASQPAQPAVWARAAFTRLPPPPQQQRARQQRRLRWQQCGSGGSTSDVGVVAVAQVRHRQLHLAWRRHVHPLLPLRLQLQLPILLRLQILTALSAWCPQ